MEFSKVFTRKFEFLEKLSLNNVKNRKKIFDETEIKALILVGSSVSELILDNTPITDQILGTLLR